MTESCRLITTEQYREYLRLKEEDNHWHKEAERISHEAIGARLEAITLKKKLDIAVKALKRAQRIFKRDNVMLHTKFVELQNAVFAANDVVCSALYKIEEVK